MPSEWSKYSVHWHTNRKLPYVYYTPSYRNADALALYFGEDLARCPFEQVTQTLLNFVRLFIKAHEENYKQAELEKKKAQKEVEMEKAKGINSTKKERFSG